VRKIDAFAHILPPSYARRLESIVSGSNVSDRILGYQQWIHEDPALVDLDARWRAGRLASPLEDPRRDAITSRLSAEPIDYFRRFFADTAMFGAGNAVRCAVEFFGTGHVLFGTDMPLGGPAVVPDTIANIEALGLPEAEASAIFAGNASEVLRLAPRP
jgi:hypothetical protein